MNIKIACLINGFKQFNCRHKGQFAVFNKQNCKELIVHPEFDVNKTTVVYIHGLNENSKSLSCRILSHAYSKRSDTNFIILDWSGKTRDHYLETMPNIKVIGSHAAELILKILNTGVETKLLHIVGYSFGSQLAGVIGKEVYKQSWNQKKLSRITALDPAFPLFYSGGLLPQLYRGIADFIDVIHTNAWLYGYPLSIGNVDFWPNGGKFTMPGVTKKRCSLSSAIESHQRSWWYWAESVACETPKFEAVKAKKWSHFKYGKYLKSGIETVPVMGHKCSTKLEGNFYLQTNGSIPFARGNSGTKYVDFENLQYY